METKFCKKCGKKLPLESAFCPYCMTKLIEVETAEPIKVKKKFPVIYIAVISAFIIIALAVAIFFLFQFNSSKSNKVDYSSYLGVWGNGENVNDTSNGQSLLEIISVKDNIVRFTFTSTSSSMKTATIENVTCEIIDGVGRFTFDEDGWFNKGVGKIKFLDDEIFIENTITEKYEYALWDIGGSYYLQKMDSSIVNFKWLLGENFKDHKGSFGEEIAEAKQTNSGTIHCYSDFNVIVSDKTNKILSVDVDYTTSLSKSLLSYETINGYSKYDDVYSLLGEPQRNKISEGFVEYAVDKNKRIEFKFDKDLNVISFSYRLSN